MKNCGVFKGFVKALGVTILAGGFAVNATVSAVAGSASVIKGQQEGQKGKVVLIDGKNKIVLTNGRPVGTAYVYDATIYANDLHKKVKTKMLAVKIGNEVVYWSLPLAERNGKLVSYAKAKVEVIPVSGKVIDDYVKKAEGLGFKVVFGKKGGGTLVVFVDTTCPFCYRHYKDLLPLMLKNYRVVFVPLPVHGEVSRGAWVLGYEKAKDKQNLYEIFANGIEEYGKVVENKEKPTDFVNRVLKVNEKVKKCKIDQLLQLGRETAIKMDVRGTPSTFILKDGKLYPAPLNGR